MNSETLCWTCKRATGHCPWSRTGSTRGDPSSKGGKGAGYRRTPKPVEGWAAEKTTIRQNSGVCVESYNVVKCPLYVPDREPAPEMPLHRIRLMNALIQEGYPTKRIAEWVGVSEEFVLDEIKSREDGE